MIRHKVTLIPGEGIGPEVATATRRILEATGVQIDWEEIAGRSDSSSDQEKTVNQAAEESVRRNRVALKGTMATAIAGGAPSVNVALRKTLDLYANLRPVKNMPGVKSHFQGVHQSQVHALEMRFNTRHVFHGTQICIQVERFAQCHVHAGCAAGDGRGHSALKRNAVPSHRLFS